MPAAAAGAVRSNVDEEYKRRAKRVLALCVGALLVASPFLNDIGLVFVFAFILYVPGYVYLAI